MGEIYRKAGGKDDVPHRHDYYTILLVGRASGSHEIDYNSHSFGHREVHFVSPGQVHQVRVSAEPDGWVFTFSVDFLLKNNIPRSFITNLSLFNPFGYSPPLSLDEGTYADLKRLIGEMEACLSSKPQYKSRALGALVQLFLIYCSNAIAVDTDQLDEENSGVCILRDFKNLVEERFTEWHMVNSYASEIHVTPKHLSQTIKSLTGKTAKELIQDRLILEAKRLLLHTNLAIKDIAYAIGFKEALHFSAFFKKKVGISPLHFRKNQL